ncbi:L,D-transpeptidase family protein [Mucilaginibacter paludis]|uniref:ErfK/YbiS/YcfS/YnhG family protein n=1 Tax=Mucilaginibacter paludis DSM 18603 TaxID=714943 RepID=H1Y6Z3_9SPHI|nr:murein L,D-transpeptidase family protein [Mucilaginibacter paludis]EHQ28400.1 ErfK/YbiS/YcfS/YnhG family protein [Mucilaginibacter paludis DSM 18603]
MLKALLVLISFFLLINHPVTDLPDSKLAADVRAAVWPRLEKELNNGGFKAGSPIYIRIFKEEHILEIWVKKDSTYSLFKTYPVCYFSGGFGTKTRINDGKSPEGFYYITPWQLNPVSHYHLAINIGYPNQLEKSKGYTGTDIMIHGHCASIGCYAMTDPLIEEIYTVVYKSLAAGQTAIPLHIFPFKLNATNMKLCAASDYFSFWNNMKAGYDLFESRRIPPVVSVVNKQYAFK